MNTEDLPAVRTNIILGRAAIGRMLRGGRDISAIWDDLFERASTDAGDAAAFLDLSSILYASGRGEEAEAVQLGALEISRNYRIQNGNGSGLNVLVFCVAGDFMANMPIEFLLESSDTNIFLQFIQAHSSELSDIPQHDIAVVAIGESDRNQATLATLRSLLTTWTGPIMNNVPRRISLQSRDRVANALCHEASILVLPAFRVARHHLSSNDFQIANIAPKSVIAGFPFVVCPVHATADDGEQQISTSLELSAYLRRNPGVEFYIRPLIDYRDEDGKYRRRRIAFVDGVAFPIHLVASNHPTTHHAGPEMAECFEGHKNESGWVEGFDADFVVRHAIAFDALHRHFGLDYFAIDCAELSDGRLVLFNVDMTTTADLVDFYRAHYHKSKAMRNLSDAFNEALTNRVKRIRSSTGVICAHSGKPAVYQRTAHDCLICALAMFTGRTYIEIQTIARECNSSFPLIGPMSHSVMRGVADKCGLPLFSSIYMLWDKPAIIGMMSPTILNSGHAVFWDGENLIDPGNCGRVDRTYVDRCAVEFIQRAIDLAPLISHEICIST